MSDLELFYRKDRWETVAVIAPFFPTGLTSLWLLFYANEFLRDKWWIVPAYITTFAILMGISAILSFLGFKLIDRYIK